MSRHLLIDKATKKVVNVIVYDGKAEFDAPKGMTLLRDQWDAGIGWLHDPNRKIVFDPVPKAVPAKIKPRAKSGPIREL